MSGPPTPGQSAVVIVSKLTGDRRHDAAMAIMRVVEKAKRYILEAREKETAAASARERRQSAANQQQTDPDTTTDPDNTTTASPTAPVPASTAPSNSNHVEAADNNNINNTVAPPTTADPANAAAAAAAFGASPQQQQQQTPPPPPPSQQQQPPTSPSPAHNNNNNNNNNNSSKTSAVANMTTEQLDAIDLLDASSTSDSNPQVYLSEAHVNDQTFSDVTFLVEGRPFYAHRVALSTSSSAFSSMFKSGFRESDGRSGAITIPNISYEIFELMMRCVYTGRATIADEHAPALLKAADQYLLEGLKLQCERELAEKLSMSCLFDMYQLSILYNAPLLQRRVALFSLRHFDALEQRLQSCATATKVTTTTVRTRGPTAEALVESEVEAAATADFDDDASGHSLDASDDDSSLTMLRHHPSVCHAHLAPLAAFLSRIVPVACEAAHGYLRLLRSTRIDG